MQFNNYTPFPGIAWEVVDAGGTWSVAAVARARFKLEAGAEPGRIDLVPDPEQGELFAADVFFGEPDRSSVRYESDFVPFKAHTDVVLNANAVAPGGRMRRRWQCGVRILSKEETLLKEYRLNVRGGLNQYKAGVVWWTGMRHRAERVPVRYERAKGGTVSIPARGKRKEKFLKVDPYNPAGCGIKKIRDPKWTVSVPQITYAGLPKWTRVPPGFGFVNRAWKSRSKLAGTYDEAWVERQHPLPPHDFDVRHNQAAHPELVMEGYLQGGSRVELLHLLEGEPLQWFEVPDLELIARVRMHTGDICRKMNLDTVLVDIDGEGGAEPGVFVSWRALLPRPLEPDAAEVMMVTRQEEEEVKHG